MTKVISRLGIIGLLIVVSGLSLIIAAPASTSPDTVLGTCPSVSNTPSFTIAYGTAVTDGSSTPVGAVIEAQNPRGDTVGCFEVTSAGNFGTMYVYGEDLSVTPPVPGMRAGETIQFYIDSISAVATPSLTWANDQNLHQLSLSVETAVDTTDPVLSVPTPITVEATSAAGTAVSYTVTATDDVDPNPVIVCVPVSGSTFSLGTTSVACTATDDSGNSSNDSFSVTVEDTTAPVLTVPATITVEAASAAGTAVSYTATATDSVDPNPSVNCTPTSGSTFSLGTTAVTCTATDGYSNSVNDSFNVVVVDTTAPALTVPESITVEAESMAGTAVTYAVTAMDAVDPNPNINCTPASGVQFPLGTTSVACIATDGNGNSSNGNFNVTVVDMPPVLSMPEPITTEADNAAGTTITYTVTATDTIDANPTIGCTPLSGSIFPLGTTSVACTATDNNSNSTNGNFTVTVTDTISPVLTMPEPITVEAESGVGTAVSYTVTATDTVDPNPNINCTLASGAIFPLGTTLVNCTATDDSENDAIGSFNVVVVDTIAPVLTVPETITVEAESGAGTAVSYSVTAIDTVDPNPVINCTPVSGTTFSLGITVVNCTATDGNGNSADGNFNVTVLDTTAPVLTVPESITVEAESMAGTAVTYTITTTDTVDPNPSINCTPISGGVFPLGTTLVTCTTTDGSGNSTNDSFNIIVVDMPPILTMPEPITVEAESMAGTVVTYIVTVTDTIDSNPVIDCAPVSDTTFPMGTTVVNCTATDDNGNSANSSFNVTVVDTTAPVLTVPETITVEAESVAGTAVTYIVTATDSVDPNPNVRCTPVSGELFPIGVTVVNCTATDNSNNSSNSSFIITVTERESYQLYLPLIIKP